MAARIDIGEALLRSATETLRPLVRQMMRNGVTFGRLERRLRELFVHVAEEESGDDGQSVTDSRVSLVTGINRKEVRRIRADDPDVPAPSTFDRNVAAALVSRWRADKRAVDRQGRPVAIPYQAERGVSFFELARETTVDLRPKALLEALVGAGAAELDTQGRVRLLRDAWVPRRGAPEMFSMLEEDPPQLLETMLGNVLEPDAPLRLQQKVQFDNIGEDALERLRDVLRKEGEKCLDRAEVALRKADRDLNDKAPGGRQYRAGIGVYYFDAPHGSAAVSAKPKRKNKEP